MPRHGHIKRWRSGTSAFLCLALAACNRGAEQGHGQPVSGAPIAALPLATASPPQIRYAPPVSALPPPPRPVAYRRPAERYRYLTDAYDMADAFGDTPPDYTVDYDGEQPWVWRADDDAYRVVEWLPEGPRYYYYEPGSDAPFLVEDPYYAYAYDDGALAGVYTPSGALVADSLARQRAYDAARYYARARQLYRAARYDRRQAAYAANWQQRAPVIIAQRARWAQARQAQPEWRDWSRNHEAREARRWAPERQHRQAYASALAAAGAANALDHAARRTQPAAKLEPRFAATNPIRLVPHLRPGERPAFAPEPQKVTARTQEARFHARVKAQNIAEQALHRPQITYGSGSETPRPAPARAALHERKAAKIDAVRAPETVRLPVNRRPAAAERVHEGRHFAPPVHSERPEMRAPALHPPAERRPTPAPRAPTVGAPHASPHAEIHAAAKPPATARAAPDKHDRHH